MKKNQKKNLNPYNSDKRYFGYLPGPLVQQQEQQQQKKEKKILLHIVIKFFNFVLFLSSLCLWTTTLPRLSLSGCDMYISSGSPLFSQNKHLSFMFTLSLHLNLLKHDSAPYDEDSHDEQESDFFFKNSLKSIPWLLRGSFFLDTFGENELVELIDDSKLYFIGFFLICFAFVGL
ncbi:hypothetical protein BpHYR1_011276 [Brachionus plicatilis]|uniref:Transmembrane protein n=1 Tax=Brachionus plicatilis TaxID=10195 RepID=A0A3M7QSS9_BRAPC|nr:hypothetical protein BpHYR1_011276 [Brachionus plicatilis]